MTTFQAGLDPRHSCFKRNALCIAIASTFVIAQPFMADAAMSQQVQTAAETAQKASPNGSIGETLEAVTVTARKKSERLQDVPLAVTAITGQTLQDTNATNVRDIVSLTPGVTLVTGGAEANVNFTIRGISDLSGGLGDPDVAVFIDGVYQSNRGAVSIGLLDLLRVEIIKGPVSAL